jgi:hypothetical protein
MQKKMIISSVFLFVSFCFFSVAFAGSTIQFSLYDKQVATESIIWSKAPDSEKLQIVQLNYMKDKFLASNFHAAIGLSSYGTLLDFITALSKIYPVDKIEMNVSNFKRVVEKPYSHARPLNSTHLTLLIVYKPHAGGTLAYMFKFAYISDTKKLKQLAKDNNFPNVDLIDNKTYLIIIKEQATESFPDDFQDMDRNAFDQLLSTPIVIVKDYIDLNK